jgi:hypothetical protein
LPKRTKNVALSIKKSGNAIPRVSKPAMGGRNRKAILPRRKTHIPARFRRNIIITPVIIGSCKRIMIKNPLFSIELASGLL